MAEEAKVVDNSFKAEGKAMRRFWMNRLKDATGVSRTGRVLEGVMCQDGQIIIQWRPPHTSIAIYKDLATFKIIHMDCHPSMNELVWLDPE